MIALGFVEHGASGFYQADGKPMQGGPHHHWVWWCLLAAGNHNQCQGDADHGDGEKQQVAFGPINDINAEKDMKSKEYIDLKYQLLVQAVTTQNIEQPKH